MKRKGIIEMAIGIIIFLILYIFVITTMVVNNSVVKQNVAENNLLLHGSKVETYVKSFLQSLKLSLLQSIYDAGNSYANKNWQCYNQNCFGSACVFDNVAKDIVVGNDSLSLIGATNYSNQYLKAYDSLPSNSNPKVNVLSTLGNPLMWSMDNLGINSYMGVTWPNTNFTLDDSNAQIDRTFVPETQINTVFRLMYDASKDLIAKNSLWFSVVEQAVLHEHSPQVVNCDDSKSTPSCSYGPVSQTWKCGPPGASINNCDHGTCPISYPAAEDVFNYNYGETITDAQNSINNKVYGYLTSLQNSLTTDSYKFEFSITNPSSDIKSYIYPNDGTTANVDGGYCNYVPVSDSDSCAICCGGNPPSCAPCGDLYTTVCNFKFYASAQTKANVTETAYPKYALYNPSLGTSTNVGLDHLHLKYTLTSGNDPSLIDCSVWTR